jgi:hypothetical protein
MTTAMGHELAVNQTGMGKDQGAIPAAIDQPFAHFISSQAFLYQRHIPQSDLGFGPSETAPGQKTLVFFGLCR